MLINVSTLLTEPVGHARRLTVDDEPVSSSVEGVEQQISGEVRLIRSERGVLVMAELDLYPVVLICGRCLEEFETSLYLAFDEEYVLERDPLTGERIPSDQDEFHIDAHRHLDLSEAVRQYGESTLPIQPLCQAGCRGLCPICGQNLNELECECRTVQLDHRWSSLANLAEQLRTEEPDGRPEA
jgi:uncharacterized protein